MSMYCKQCAEPFPKNQPFDLFELRRHTYLPADPESTIHNSVVGDGGTFCSRKCLTDYLKSTERSAAADLGSMRNRL
jgi:hypothetical protein